MLVFGNQGECAVNYLHGKVQSVIVCETRFHWSSRSRSGVGVGVGVDSAGSESLKNQSTPQPCFSTHALMRPGIPHIAISSVSAEKQHQTDREFSIRVAFDVTRFILVDLVPDGRSPRGFRWRQVWAVARSYPLALK